MKFLITGFDPFGGESLNPAWEAVNLLPEIINEAIIIKKQIPTVFHESTVSLLSHIKEIQPDIVLCIGQAGGRFDLNIERIGINIDDARIPDNQKNQPVDQIIYPDGENAYFVNLPIKKMVQNVKNLGIPCSVSNTAGTFVCNHILYSLLYHINKHNIVQAGGFIHVPYIPNQVLDKKDQPSMSLDNIMLGIVEMIKTIKAESTL